MMYKLVVVHTDATEHVWKADDNRKALRNEGRLVMDLMEAFPAIFASVSYLSLRNAKNEEVEWFDLSTCEVTGGPESDQEVVQVSGVE